MPTYLSPGVYTRETDFSFYVKQISTSAAAMVGIAERGPINKPTLVTSWEQFVNQFGSYITTGYLAYAARAFFDNGGAVLYVCRVAHQSAPTDRSTLTAVKSTVSIKNRAAQPADTLRVKAASEGSWGDRLAVQIEDGTRDPQGSFNLIVRHKGEVVEVFKDLSMDESSPSHAELSVNGRSEWITVEDLFAASGLATDRPAVGTYSLTGGENGLTGMTDADYTGDPSQHTGFYAFDEIDALNLLMVPGVTTAAVISAGLAYAEGRKDILFIADTPAGLEPLEAVEFRKGEGTYDHAAFSSSYGALYYPWLEIADPVTGNKKLVPPSGAVAGCYARSDQKTYVWYAPAGIDRGRIFNVLSAAYNTSQGERDVLYPEGVNVIAVFPDSGVTIWGQRTLQAQPSAVDRVNVRRLMMYMEEAIAESSRFVVMEPNNPQTWRSLIRLINPFMQDIKDKGGLYDFAVQCDEETNTAAARDRYEIICRVFVKPTKTAEFVELNFVLTTTGADFKEIFSA